MIFSIVDVAKGETLTVDRPPEELEVSEPESDSSDESNLHIRF